MASRLVDSNARMLTDEASEAAEQLARAAVDRNAMNIWYSSKSAPRKQWPPPFSHLGEAVREPPI